MAHMIDVPICKDCFEGLSDLCIDDLMERGVLVANSGAVGGSFLVDRRAWRALTGHRCKLSICGSWTTW